VDTNWRFSTNKPLYLRNGARYDKGYNRSLIGNRIRAFDWYQNWRPWLTLKWPWKAIMHSVTLHTCVSEPWAKICMKTDPHYHRQKCSPGILVSFMRIFAWGSLEMARQMRVGWSKMEIFASAPLHVFRSLYLPNLHIWGHIYYIVLCSPLVALQWYRNRWPWMTLNGHFALKFVSGSATNGLASPAFGQNCSKICRTTHCQRQKCSPGT